MADLATFTGLERSTVSGLIDRASQRGLVVRAADPVDGQSGWSSAPVNFKVQWPYNLSESDRYTFSGGVYHLWRGDGSDLANLPLNGAVHAAPMVLGADAGLTTTM